jgi:peroxiredoxin
MAQELEQTPLEYGKLAPDFSLISVSGEKVTRSQYRNKSALILIFFQPTPEAVDLLKAIVRDTAEYAELNAHLIGIGRASQDDLARLAESHALSLTLLADQQGTAWKAYSGVETPGYGAFVLDMYGGVDSQKVVASISDLPDAAMILNWARAAQYRCSI